jgi:hypothetical protein
MQIIPTRTSITISSTSNFHRRKIHPLNSIPDNRNSTCRTGSFRRPYHTPQKRAITETDHMVWQNYEPVASILNRADLSGDGGFFPMRWQRKAKRCDKIDDLIAG